MLKIKILRFFSVLLSVLMLFTIGLNASAAKVSDKAKVEKVEIEDMTVRYRGKQGVNVTLHTTDKNLGYKVEYFSSDENIFTVDEEGYVIAGERGTAEITIKVTDDNGNVVTDTAQVTVKFSSRQWVIYIFLFGWIWY
ncbi:MAG: hypothetical protein IJ279_04830 [Clostridia bacterium]|nr:hypothetical protein [Clostridia bacterium]